MEAEVTVSALASKTVDVGKYNDRNQPIRKFTPHYMAGDLGAEACANMHKNESRDASANYYIGSDGVVVAGMQEEKRSWCSSSGENDHQAITVEVANVNENGEVTQEAWNSLVNLGADICTRYNFSLNWTGDKSGSLTNHDMFSSTSCPGNYLRGKMPQLAQEVNAKIGAPTTGLATTGGATTSISGDDPYSSIPADFVNLEFSYGYHDGQMSEVHRGFMTEYSIDFSAAGATLTIEGRSMDCVAFKDPQSVTYKNMTIEEIIRSIAEEEGWIIEEDSIEPIAEVKESEIYSITTGSAAAGFDIQDLSTVGTGSGSISDGNVTSAQQEVITSATNTGFQGTGWCAMWVSKVFAGAGFEYPGGNADDMYRDWCTSSNQADLKPGMIIAVAPSGATGNHYGHVGIYIGNGQVMHNADSVRTDSLDYWISTYGPEGSHPHSNPVKWGWMQGKNLAA